MGKRKNTPTHTQRKKKRKWNCSVVSDSFWEPMDYSLPGSSMEFSRQEYWSGLSFPSPGDLSHPEMEPGSPALHADTLPCEPQGKPTGKQFIWLRIRAEISTQRKRVWTPSLMRRSAVIQKLCRNTVGKECRHPEWGGDVSHLYRTVLPGLCLPLANYLVSFFTPDWSMDPPKDACATFF